MSLNGKATNRNDYKAYKQRERKSRQQKNYKKVKRNDDAGKKAQLRNQYLLKRSRLVRVHPILKRLRIGEYFIIESCINEKDMKSIRKLLKDNFIKEPIKEGDDERRITRFQRRCVKGQNGTASAIFDMLEPLRLCLQLENLLQVSSCSLLQSTGTRNSNSQGQQAHRDQIYFPSKFLRKCTYGISCIYAYDDNTKLYYFDGDVSRKKVNIRDRIIISIPKNHFLIFHGCAIHAGYDYKTYNDRLHVALNFNYDRGERFEWVDEVH